MLQEIENEYKYLITAEQFQKTLSECNLKYYSLGNKLQVNYYYDTEDNALNRNKTTVRIRQHHSDMRLQVKKHAEAQDGLTTSDEYSENMDTLPSVLKLPGVLDSLHLKGVLVTERKTFLIGQNSRICFDGNIYLGVCDYEVEIEVDEADADEVMTAIKYLDLTKKPIISKSERFFARLETMKGE